MGTGIEIPHGRDVVLVSLPTGAIIERVAPAVVPMQAGTVAIDRLLAPALHAARAGMACCTRVVIVVDDHTRVTPARELLSPIIAAAKNAGKTIEILVAGGSHRHMTREEKREKLGDLIADTFPVFDHAWNDDREFENLGRLEPPGMEPVELFLNARVCDPDAFVVAVGNIVPHRVVGFSGGYKILLPGVTNASTMNEIHYASAMYRSEDILGIARNPVRDAVNAVHDRRPINLLVNTVLDGNSTLVSLCAGSPIDSQYQGAAIAKEVYGVPVRRPAGVVIADAVPESVDFWTCAKAVTNCKAFVARGGHLVVFAPCTEGWAPGHERVLFKHGYHEPETIDAMVRSGEIDATHLVEASHLSHVGEVLGHCHVHLVSDTLDKRRIGNFGIDVVRVSEVNDLLASACTPENARVTVVSRGSEVLPLVPGAWSLASTSTHHRAHSEPSQQ